MSSLSDAVPTPTISTTSVSFTLSSFPFSSSSSLNLVSSNDHPASVSSSGRFNQVASSGASTATSIVGKPASNVPSETALESTTKTATTTSGTPVTSSNSSVRTAVSSMSSVPTSSHDSGAGDSSDPDPTSPAGGGSDPTPGPPGGGDSTTTQPPPTSSTKPPPSSSPSSPPSSTPKPPSSTPKPTTPSKPSSTRPPANFPVPSQPPSPPSQPPSPPGQQPSPTSQPPPSNIQIGLASGPTSSDSGNSPSLNNSAGLTSNVSGKSTSLVGLSGVQSATNKPDEGAFPQSSARDPEGSPSHSVSSSSNDVNKSGFFSNHGRAAGIFVAIGIVVLLVLALIPCLLARSRRRSRSQSRPRPPSMRTYTDLQYRRASQVQAFSDSLAAGASLHRGLSARSVGSVDSSSDANHSTEPITSRGLNPFRNLAMSSDQSDEGYMSSYTRLGFYAEMMKTQLSPVPEIPTTSNNSPYPQITPTAPVRSAGLLLNYSRPQSTTRQSETMEQASLQPPKPLPNPFRSHSRESSPSFYPSSLPSNDDDDKETEETYWQKQGFEKVSDSEPLSTISTQPSKRLPTPPDSALGFFHPVTSQTSMKQSVASDNESDLVGNLHSQMQPPPLHTGSTAPIRMPLNEGRY